MNVVTAAAAAPKGETTSMIPTDKPVAAVPAAADTKPSRAEKSKHKKPPARRPSKKATLRQRAQKTIAARRGPKTAKILALLRRPGGASLDQLKKATGWQAHSVRGFLSGALKKKMGLRIDSAKRDGERTYRLASK
jgi:hypothetical protein